MSDSTLTPERLACAQADIVGYLKAQGWAVGPEKPGLITVWTRSEGWRWMALSPEYVDQAEAENAKLGTLRCSPAPGEVVPFHVRAESSPARWFLTGITTGVLLSILIVWMVR